MPALWMGLGMGALQGGLALFGGANEANAQANAAYTQAKAAEFEAWKSQRQFEHGEFMNKMQNQIKNRQTAKANATRFIQNQKIAESANINRAEEEFWIRWNFDNEAEAISKKHQQVNNSLIKSLDKRNINLSSGNARALLRASLNNSGEMMVDRRVSARNKMKGAERKQLAALSKRDFGYNSHTTYIPGLFLQAGTVDPMAAANSAYSTGMTSAVLSGISGAAQGAFMGAQMGDMMGGTPATPGGPGGPPAGQPGSTYAGPPAPTFASVPSPSNYWSQ